MKNTDTTPLPDDIESLKKLVLSLQKEIKKEAVEVKKHQSEAKYFQKLYYEILEKWQLALRQRFAASSEVYQTLSNKNRPG